MHSPLKPYGTPFCPFAHVGCSRGVVPVSVPSESPKAGDLLAGLFCGPFGEPFQDLVFEEKHAPREEWSEAVFQDPFGTSVRDPWWDDCA